MVDNKQLKPFINIGPGYTMKKYIEARGWTQNDLAQLLDLSAKQLSQIINDKARITIDTGRLLAKAFDTSAEFWINLDTQYRLNLESNTQKETQTQRKAHIRKYMPVSEIQKKGWYSFDSSAEGYEELYESIWNKSCNDTTAYNDSQQKFYARQKKQNEDFTRLYSLTWQQIARKKAKPISVPEYNEEKLKNIIKGYTDYTISSTGIKDIIKDLNSAGVKFLTLSHLSKTYLDGACFIDNSNPVIVYTARYDRIDNFWFTLAHEIAHVLLHFGIIGNECFLDDLKDGEISNRYEREADLEAEKVLRVDEILAETKSDINYLTETKLKSISDKLHIEKSVILGVLQHYKLIDYRKLSRFKQKVLDKIPAEVVFG